VACGLVAPAEWGVRTSKESGPTPGRCGARAVWRRWCSRRGGRLSLSLIEVDSHTRTFFVTGEGLLRFLQMTNWE